MAHSHTTSRTFFALILLGAMTAAFFALGNWQLQRAAQREAIVRNIETGRNSTPLRLTAHTAHPELVEWRTANASGTWLNELTVLLENRNFKGRPGYWVATPLLIDPASNIALLVLRGWLPRTLGPNQPLPAIPALAGEQKISGQLVNHVPRLFELWSFGAGNANALPAQLPRAGQPVPTLQNLDLNGYARATGLKLLPTVLEQTSTEAKSLEAAAGDDNIFGRDWPLPPIDSNQNKGYALQWFAFAAIAGGAWLVVAWRALRRRKNASGAQNMPPR